LGTNQRSRRLRRAAKRGNNVLLPLTKVPSLKTFVEKVTPPEIDIKLNYSFNKLLTAAGSAVVAVRFNPNAAYDVDPTLGSTSTPGFAEWAAIYNFYRVVAFSYDAEFVNNEAFPVICWSFASNTDPTTAATSIITSNPLTKTGILSSKTGNDRHKVRGRHMISGIVGTDAVEYEDNYRALTNAVPADLVWLAFGLHSATGANLTLGAVLWGNITMFVRFYDRKILSS